MPLTLLQTVDFSINNMKAKSHSGHFAGSFKPACTRIHQQHPVSRVTHHLGNVGMPIYEQIGMIGVDKRLRNRIIRELTGRKAPVGALHQTDMRHQHPEPFALKLLKTGINAPNIHSVHIAMHPQQGLVLGNLPGETDSSPEIAGMPDDIDRRQKFFHIVGKGAVGI